MNAASLRAVLRLASRDAWRHKGRSALIALTLAFPVVGLVAAATLVHALAVPQSVKVSWTLGQADVAIQGFGADSFGASSEQASAAAVRAKLPAGSTTLPYRIMASRAFRRGGLVRQVEVSDLPYARPIASGLVHSVSGRAPVAAHEVAISPAFASSEHLRVGSTVVLQDVTDRAFTVVGLAELPDEVDQAAAWVAEGVGDLAQAGGPQVLATVPAGTDTAKLTETFGNQANVTTRAALLAQPAPLLQGTQQVGLTVLVVGLALLEAVLMAGAAFAVGARRSQRDLALVGAAGGDARQVGGIVLSGGLVLGAVGGVLGTLAGLAVAEALLPYAPRLSHHVYAGTHPRLVELVGAALVGVLTGLISACVPARGAAKAPILASLTGRRGTARTSRRLTSAAVCGAVIGTLIAAWAGRTSRLGGQQINAVLFGAAVAELGFAGCAPALLGLSGQLAGRLPLAARLSLRDIARNRSRTGPAVAAIMATLSGVVAMGVYVASSNAQARAHYSPALPRNVVALQGQATALPRSALVAAAAAALPVKATVDYQRSYDEKQAYIHGPGSQGSRVTVTDPALLTALGQPAAAAAVSRGAVAVADPALLHDGTVTVTVSDGSTRTTRELPAVAAQISENLELGNAFVSQATARTLRINETYNTVALVLTGPVKPHDRDAARSALLQLQSPNSPDYVSLEAETGFDNGKSLLIPLALLAISTLVTFGVTTISTALSAAEGRPDLATLGAVGASPLLRRRLAVTQAAVLALLGGVLGILAGLVPMAAVIAVRSDVLTFTVPWQVIALSLVGVPALAGVGAGVFTRSRLPLVRRLT